jgi:hypothetical protein
MDGKAAIKVTGPIPDTGKTFPTGLGQMAKIPYHIPQTTADKFTPH